MIRRTNETSAAERARVLAELAEALSEARQVALRLQMLGVDKAGELLDPIAAAERELDALRRGRRDPYAADNPPNWNENLPWCRSG